MTVLDYIYFGLILLFGIAGAALILVAVEMEDDHERETDI